MTPKLAATLATPRWGFSLPVLDSLSSQRSDSIVGVLAFLLALTLGVAGVAFAPPDMVFSSRASGLLSALLVTGGVAVVLLRVARGLERRHNTAARIVILENAFNEVVVEKHVEKAYIDALIESAEVLFGIQFAPQSSPQSVVEEVRKLLGREIPADTRELLSESSHQ
jgi:hypothetical protein